MIHTTVENFDPQTGHASPDLGVRQLGALEPGRLIAVLTSFLAVDRIENEEAEPRITLETRRQKRVVTTTVGRLYVQEPSNRLSPTLVMTPEEIIAEIDGSAALARNRRVAESARKRFLAHALLPKVVRSVPPPRTPLQIALSVIALILGTYSALPLFAANPALDPAIEIITDAGQIETCRNEFAGVYLTGTTAGHHGIAIGVSGTLTLFQLNNRSEPSQMYGRYSFGRMADQIFAIGTLPGGLLRFTGKDTLLYGGETYERSR